MVFGGIKKVFNRIGNLTVNSSQKVGGGVQKVGEGVQKPVKRIREVERPKISRPAKRESQTDLSTFEPSKSASKTQSPRKVIKKMGMEKDEIEIYSKEAASRCFIENI